MVASSHSSAQLVQLGQTKAVCPLNDERVGTGDIEATFDDRRRDQHIGALVDKLDHLLFQFEFIHLAMCHRDLRLWQQGLHPVFAFVDAGHTIVEPVDLPIAIDFTQGNLPESAFVEGGHLRLDRGPAFRRFMETGDVFHTDQ